MPQSPNTATAAASPSSSATTAALPYPNALQARHTTEEHRRIAAAAVFEYQDSLADEQARLQRDDLVLSEEETAQLQRRIERQQAANATAEQFRQRACDVVKSIQDGNDALNHGNSNNKKTSSAKYGIDIYHAACDGDVGLLAAWVKNVPLELLSAQINAQGQPDPTTYNGVQFQQRWLFRAPPLIFAAAFGREDAVHFLLLHGADPRVKSSTGLRAVDYAAKRGYSEIVAMLRGES